jgi:hypothetical protein
MFEVGQSIYPHIAYKEKDIIKIKSLPKQTIETLVCVVSLQGKDSLSAVIAFYYSLQTPIMSNSKSRKGLHQLTKSWII